MRGHSSYTSWYFVERAEISDVNVNVTISLSSSILSTHAPGSVSLPENRGGLFSRVIGASGFQLINVNNVPLQLSGWSTDTKLIGRRALQGSLTRHYIGQSIKEAHKVGVTPQIMAPLALHACQLTADMSVSKEQEDTTHHQQPTTAFVCVMAQMHAFLLCSVLPS